MQADWIPPEPGEQAVGSDDDLAPRRAARPEFGGEFDERAAAPRLPGTASDNEIDREQPEAEAVEREEI